MNNARRRRISELNWELRDLEELILNAAHEKFGNLVSLLIKSEPSIYIK